MPAHGARRTLQALRDFFVAVALAREACHLDFAHVARAPAFHLGVVLELREDGGGIFACDVNGGLPDIFSAPFGAGEDGHVVPHAAAALGIFSVGPLAGFEQPDTAFERGGGGAKIRRQRAERGQRECDRGVN